MRAVIKHEVVNGVMVLRGMGGMSITNDAESVVQYCLEKLGLKPDMPLVYEDTMGNWDQLEHDGAKFTGFKHLGAKNKDDAVLLTQDPAQDSGGDFWRFHKLKSQQHRAEKREQGPKILQALGIPFEVKNDGAHLMIGKPVIVHFWPGTGTWHVQGVSRINGRGIDSLLAWLKKHHPNLVKGEQK